MAACTSIPLYTGCHAGHASTLLLSERLKSHVCRGWTPAPDIKEEHVHGNGADLRLHACYPHRPVSHLIVHEAFCLMIKYAAQFLKGPDSIYRKQAAKFIICVPVLAVDVFVSFSSVCVLMPFQQIYFYTAMWYYQQFNTNTLFIRQQLKLQIKMLLG